MLKGLDPLKDQSYFLHRLTQAQLAKTLFPVGELPKTEVRRIAAEIGLPNAKKKDSTGICFIGERPFREFLNRYLANAPGPIKDDRGRTIGEHVGLSFYTLGQRKGIGIGGLKERSARTKGGSEHAPWFVARKDMARNTLYVVQGHDHPWLLSHRAERRRRQLGRRRRAGRAARWPRRRATARPMPPARSRPRATAASRCASTQPQWAVTPGQSAVLYDGEVCLGGGVIASAEAWCRRRRGAPLERTREAARLKFGPVGRYNTQRPPSRWASPCRHRPCFRFWPSCSRCDLRRRRRGAGRRW